MNIYKIQSSQNSEAIYVICETLIQAIEIWKRKIKRDKDPEIVEWIADHYFSS